MNEHTADGAERGSRPETSSSPTSVSPATSEQTARSAPTNSSASSELTSDSARCQLAERATLVALFEDDYGLLMKERDEWKRKANAAQDARQRCIDALDKTLDRAEDAEELVRSEAAKNVVSLQRAVKAEAEAREMSDGIMRGRARFKRYRKRVEPLLKVVKEAAPALKEWLENEYLSPQDDTIEAMWSICHAVNGEPGQLWGKAEPEPAAVEGGPVLTIEGGIEINDTLVADMLECYEPMAVHGANAIRVLQAALATEREQHAEARAEVERLRKAALDAMAERDTLQRERKLALAALRTATDDSGINDMVDGVRRIELDLSAEHERAKQAEAERDGARAEVERLRREHRDELGLALSGAGAIVAQRDAAIGRAETAEAALASEREQPAQDVPECVERWRALLPGDRRMWLGTCGELLGTQIKATVIHDCMHWLATSHPATIAAATQAVPEWQGSLGHRLLGELSHHHGDQDPDDSAISEFLMMRRPIVAEGAAQPAMIVAATEWDLEDKLRTQQPALNPETIAGNLRVSFVYSDDDLEPRDFLLADDDGDSDISVDVSALLEHVRIQQPAEVAVPECVERWRAHEKYHYQVKAALDDHMRAHADTLRASSATVVASIVLPAEAALFLAACQCLEWLATAQPATIVAATSEDAEVPECVERRCGTCEHWEQNLGDSGFCDALKFSVTRGSGCNSDYHPRKPAAIVAATGGDAEVLRGMQQSTGRSFSIGIDAFDRATIINADELRPMVVCYRKYHELCHNSLQCPWCTAWRNLPDSIKALAND